MPQHHHSLKRDNNRDLTLDDLAAFLDCAKSCTGHGKKIVHVRTHQRDKIDEIWIDCASSN